MSNYPNMSYCAVSNTLLALRQVVDSMHDGVDFYRGLSRDERRAYDELYDVCRNFEIMADELQDELDSEYERM